MSKDIQTIFPDWKIVRMLGQGSFGVVYEIQRELFGLTERAALKVISIPQNESDIDEMYGDGYDEESITSSFQRHLENIVREYALMRQLDTCANIVHCEDVKCSKHEDGIGWDIYIKMELLTPIIKSLPDIIPEDLVIKVAKDICKALVECEERGVIHRDIKPQNIFISESGTYKLGDFGIAKTVEKTMGGTKIGTYKYMAPEVYNNQPYKNGADIYSLGLVLYWLLNERRLPFLPLPPAKISAGADEQARARRFSGETITAPKHGSIGMKRIVLRACAYKAEERYQSAYDMLQELESLTEVSQEKKRLEEEEILRKKREEEEQVQKKIKEKEEILKKQQEIRKEKMDKTFWKKIVICCGVLGGIACAIIAYFFIEGIEADNISEITSAVITESSEDNFVKMDSQLLDLASLSAEELLDEFVNGNIMASYASTDQESFYITDLSMDGDDIFSYSVGDKVDLDNDGELELILNAPYGGMFLDARDGAVYVLDSDGGATAVLSYTTFDDQTWVIHSDTTHAGRNIYEFTRYDGSGTEQDSFQLTHEFWETPDIPDAPSAVYTYRGETISREKYMVLREKMLHIPISEEDIMTTVEDISIRAKYLSEEYSTTMYNLQDMDANGEREHLVIANRKEFTGIDDARLMVYFNGEIVYELMESLRINFDDVKYIDLDGDGEEEIFFSYFPEVNSVQLVQYRVLKKTGDKWKALPPMYVNENGYESFPVSVKYGDTANSVIIECEGYDGKCEYNFEDFYKEIIKKNLHADVDSFKKLLEGYDDQGEKYQSGDFFGEIAGYGPWEVGIASKNSKADEWCLRAGFMLEDPYDMIYGKINIYFDYREDGLLDVFYMYVEKYD